MSYSIRRCIVCDGEDLTFRCAVVAPFVAHWVFGHNSAVCRLARCENCGMIFFEDRFEDAEAAKLYADYRGPAYFLERHHWEPWYSQALNAELGGDAEMHARRAVYVQTVHAYANEISTVLDHGGDRGQLMKNGPGRDHFVYDISGVPPAPGVSSLDAQMLKSQTFDLVLSCEVLEHLSAPMELLNQIASLTKPGGYLFITVPNVEFQFDDLPAGAWYKKYLRAILKLRYIFLVADFWSTGFRVKFRRVPVLGFVKLHEHINFFNQASLEIALSRSGLTILACHCSSDKRGLIAFCQRTP